MLRKGYIQEQIEGLVRMLAKLLGLREKGADPKENLEVIREASSTLTGMALEQIMTLPDAMFYGLFTSGDHLEAGKATIIATLLNEEADELAHLGHTPEELAPRYNRAFRLLSMAMTQEESLRTPDMAQRLKTLYSRQNQKSA